MRNGSSNAAAFAGLVLVAAAVLASKRTHAVEYEFPETPSARAELERLAASGDARAAYELFRFFRSESLMKNDLSARVNAVEPMVRYLRQAAEAGNLEAMGEMYGVHWSIREEEVAAKSKALVSKDEAAFWLRRAASGGHASSMYLLGAGLNQRGTTPEEVAEGFGWLVRCEAMGYRQCVEAVADAYFLGQGVNKNSAEALRRYETLIDGPEPGTDSYINPWIQNRVAVLLHQGVDGRPADQASALVLLRRAAEAGVPESMQSLAIYYEHGLGGLSPSLSEALRWQREAAKKTHPDRLAPIQANITRLEAAVAAGQSAVEGQTTSAQADQRTGQSVSGAYSGAAPQVSALSASEQDAMAQSGVDPDLLTQLQGIWVSRFPRKGHSVEVRGANVLVRVESANEIPAPRGTVVAVIIGVREKRPIVSEVDGRTLHTYEFDMRKWSNHGGGSSGGFRMSDNSYRHNYLTVYTSQCRDRGGNLKPYFNFFQLSGFWGGDMVRQADKDRWFPPNDTRPNWADPIVPACP